MGNEAEVETRRIIVPHGLFIIGIIFVYQANLFNGIILRIKFLENSQKLRRDINIANHFPLMSHAVNILVEKM